VSINKADYELSPAAKSMLSISSPGAGVSMRVDTTKWSLCIYRIAKIDPGVKAGTVDMFRWRLRWYTEQKPWNTVEEFWTHEGYEDNLALAMNAAAAQILKLQKEAKKT
jgi:hypothetical protein